MDINEALIATTFGKQVWDENIVEVYEKTSLSIAQIKKQACRSSMHMIHSRYPFTL